MSTKSQVSFWGAAISANVWLAVGNSTVAALWLVFAIGIYVGEKIWPEAGE